MALVELTARMVSAHDDGAVLAMPIFIARSLERSSWFHANYSPVLAVPLTRETWGDREVVVFARNDVRSRYATLPAQPGGAAPWRR